MRGWEPKDNTKGIGCVFKLPDSDLSVGFHLAVRLLGDPCCARPESLRISRLWFRFLSLALVCFCSGDKSKMKSCFPSSGKAVSNNGKSTV